MAGIRIRRLSAYDANKRLQTGQLGIMGDELYYGKFHATPSQDLIPERVAKYSEIPSVPENVAIAPATHAANLIPAWSSSANSQTLVAGYTVETAATSVDTAIPTSKAVRDYADGLLGANDAMLFKGVINCSGNPNYPAADAGHVYKVSVAGRIGGASGPKVEIGDTLFCLTDSTDAGTHAAVGEDHWNILQVNVDGAVTGPASVTNGRVAFFSGTSGKVIDEKTAGEGTVTISAATARTITLGANLATGALAGDTITINNQEGFNGDTTNKVINTHVSTFTVGAHTENGNITIKSNSGSDRTLTLGNNASVAGANTGDQTIELTGNVTGSGTGTFAATIANQAVTHAKFQDVAAYSVVGRGVANTGVTTAITAADNQVLRRSGTSLGFGLIVNANITNSTITLGKLANMATASFIGRNTAGTGSPEVLTAATARSILNVEDGANNFTYVHPTGSGNEHLPTGGEEDNILIWHTGDQGQWVAEIDEGLWA